MVPHTIVLMPEFREAWEADDLSHLHGWDRHPQRKPAAAS